MNVTSEQLKAILKNNKNPLELAVVFNVVFPKYEINTVNRIAGFIAQCGHESRDFTILAENLHYSPERLRQVFPRMFASVDAAIPYNTPEKIGNKLYANRMGNGSEESGDGYRFRGRGAIQLTGRNNYEAFAKAIGKPILEAVAYCETLEGAIESACWFWKNNSLNQIADEDNIVKMTQRINGGQIGIDDRTIRYNNAKKVLSS